LKPITINRLIVPLLIIIIELIIFFKMLQYTGYVQWGNFAFPLRNNIYNSLKIITWDPYSYNGIPVITPWISLFGNLSNLSIIIFGGLLNLNIAVKIYILISTFFMVFSFYIFIGAFVHPTIPKVIAMVFILLNPLTLQLIGQGDPFQFIVWGFYFLSVWTFKKYTFSVGSHKQIYFLISLIMLSFTVAIPQIFYLGVPLYIIFIFYFLLVEEGNYSKHAFLSFIKILFLSLSLLAMLIMPLVLTTLFGAFDLSPTSSFANPLNNYIAYSATFFNLLEMNAYPMLQNTVLLGALNSHLFAEIWHLAIGMLVFFIFLSGIAFRNVKMLFFEFIVIVAALIGSGYSSPISSFNVFLYTHMPGYQVLNTSYYWEWLVIVPFFAIVLSMMVENLLSACTLNKRNSVNNAMNYTSLRSLDNTLTKKWNDRARIFMGRIKSKLPIYSIIVVFLLIFTIILPPLVGQGFYGGGNSGIHQDGVPKSYNSLISKLDGLIGSSQVGVAYFTPDNYVYFGNNTNGVSQPLFNDPGFRSPGVPSYLSPPVVSSNYFYWAYTQFYMNRTHYIAQLMGLMGIKYFVTLNGVISASTLYIANSANSSDLMRYQHDVKLINETSSYDIYESTLKIDAANSAKSFTLFSSNYNTLLNAADLGLNISDLSPVLTGDMSQSDFNFFFNNISSMILWSNQSLISLAIDRFANDSNSVDPLRYTDNYDDSTYEGWINSNVLETSSADYIISSPYPFAITSTDKPLTSTFTTSGSGNYSLWAYILNSPFPASSMKFDVNGRVEVVNTSIENAMGNFSWIKIPVNVSNSSVNFTATSLSGINGIERIVLLKKGAVSSEIVSIDHFIKIKHINVLYLDKNGAVQLGETGIEPLGITLRNSQHNSTGTYQQVVQIPIRYLSNYANSNLSNVQWQYASGKIIPSWLQSFNSSVATWWIKVSNIPADGNLTVYLAFFAKNHSVLNSFNTGESSLINPSFDDGRSVFNQYNSTSLVGSGTNILYPTDHVGFYFYTNFYNPSGIPLNQGLVGWNYRAGIDTPMFAGLSNTTYLQPFYYVNGSNYLSPHIKDGSYHLLGTGLIYPEAYWFVNNTIVATANSTYFTNSSETYIRPTGVNISVLYSFMTTLPPNAVMPSVSVISICNPVQIVTEINDDTSGFNPMNVSNNPNGYTISGNINNITFVRYGYFQGMIETIRGFGEIPVMGGLDYVLISVGSHTSASFISKDYSFLLEGIILFTGTVSGSVGFIIFDYIRHRRRDHKW